MIEIKNLNYRVGRKNILKDINLEFNEGELVFITGSSGSGKTSLLNMLGGLEKPTSGEILTDGKDIYDDITKYRSSVAGFVFQDYNLIDDMNAYDNVRLGGLYAGKDDNEMGENLLKDFGIKDSKQKSKTMSGGEKQRLAILRCLYRDSEVIFADEPTGNLDPDNSKMVMDELSKLKKGRYIIIVSHDLELAKKYADRIVRIENGVIKSNEVLNDISDSSSRSVEHNMKRQNRFKADFLVIVNSLRHRLWKVLGISLILAIAASMILVTDSLDKDNRVNMDKFNIDYLDSDLLNVVESTRLPSAMAYQIGIKDEIVEKIQGLDLSEIVYIYDNDNYYTFEVKGAKYRARVRRINIDDFFKKRIMTDGVIGSFPQNDNEIIIASDVAKKMLGSDDCIGKVITVKDPNLDISLDLKVVGVNYNKDSNDEIRTYIPANTFIEITKSGKEAFLKDFMFLGVKTDDEDRLVKYDDISAGGIRVVESDLEMLCGRLPENKGEVCVTEGAIRMRFRDYSDEKDFLDWYNKYSSQDIVADTNGRFDYKLVGVVKNNDEALSYVVKEDYDEVFKLRPTNLQIYVKDLDKIENIRNTIIEYGDFVVNTDHEQLKLRILINTERTNKLLKTYGYAFLALACIFLTSFMLINTLERKYEIGIVKSLGGTSCDSLMILISDAFVITLFTGLMTIPITRLIQIKLPDFIKDFKYTLFVFRWDIYGSCLLGIFGVVLLVSFICNVKFAFSSCAKLLK